MSLRVLVVEDHPDTAAMLAKWVELAGHSAHICATGFRALMAAPEFSPDVVLLDIGLPDMNGWDLASSLRNDPKFGDVPIIVISAYQTKEDRLHSAEVGVSLHLGKPVFQSDVVGALAQLESE